MSGCRGDMEKRRHLCFNIVESMDFYPWFSFQELSPVEDCEVEFDGRRIESINRSAKIENLRNIHISSFLHHIMGRTIRRCDGSGSESLLPDCCGLRSRQNRGT